MNKVLKYIGIAFIALFLIGAIFGEETPADEPINVINSTSLSDGVQADSSTPVDTPAQSTGSTNAVSQDIGWVNSVSKWTPLLSYDLKQVGDSTTNLKYDYIKEDAFLLQIDSEGALKESLTYTVSPQFLPAKREYEAGLRDLITSSTHLQTGMDYFNAGDFDRATEHFNSASSYMNSGAGHISKASSLMPV
jgi:hypothetical protein